MEIPCIFDVDPETNEATGTVAPFCSEGCRTKAGGEEYPGFKAGKLGISNLGDFGYTPHCEECGREISAIKVHGWVVTCSSNVTAKDVLPYGFRLEGDVLFPDDVNEIRRLLGTGFSVTDVTDPRTESSRGLPARSIRVERILFTPA